MQKILSVFIVIFLFLPIQKSFTQIATNDPTFNPADIGFGNGDGPNGMVYAMTVLADGKILVAGSFNYYNQKSQGRIMKLNPDGSVDPTFTTGTGFNGDVNAMVVQPDGKILVAGLFGIYNGQFVTRIARLNADGTLDASFNSGTGVNNSVRAMALQTDGKIVIAGHFSYYNGIARNFVARLNADGSLDATFNPGTGPDLYVYSMALQSDGKVIIGGIFSNINNTARKYIARLNNDGSLDNSFTVGSGTDQSVSAITIQQDSKILLGGKFTKYNGATAQGICRLNIDGTLDASFTISTQEVLAITVQSDDKILIGGNFNTINSSMSFASLARLNIDGSVDNSFNPIPASTIQSIAVQADGQVLAGGAFPSFGGLGRYRLFRLHEDGIQDLTFNPGTGADNFVSVLAVLPDDKIIIGGAFNYYNGKPRNHIARLNADGTLDETFNPGTGTDGTILAIAVQPDGKVIIGGQFYYYNGSIRRCLARLNADGSLDATFNPSGYGVNGAYIRSILIQSDGKIIIGGNFTMYNQAGAGALARITSTGAYDVSFTPGISNPSTVESLLMQADGKIIVAGSFSSYGGVARNNIARITSNGSLDASFNPGQGTDSPIYTASLQSDQKILLGGTFASYDGTSVNHLVRVNTDGSRDASFDAGAWNNTMSIVSLLMQPDNKILVTGYFTYYGSYTVGSFARLNTNGSLDANFIANTGSDNSTYTAGLQSDGKIILGGAFAGFNSTGRNRITRLLTTACTPPAITGTTPATLCGDGAATLGATANAGTVKWYTAANGGEPFTTGNSYTTPVLTSSETYYVETLVAGCPSGRTAVTATINKPQVTLISNVGRCDAGTVTLTAAGSAGSTLKWYDASSNGNLLGTGTTYTTPVISSVTDYYVEASIGTCVVAARRNVKGIVNNTPVLLSTTPGSVCESGKAVLQASFSGGSVRWYSESTGGTILNSTSSFTTPTISSPATYYVEAISGGCLSARVPVEATVDHMPSITETTPGIRCGYGTVILKAASDIGTLNWYSSSLGGFSQGTGTSFTTPPVSSSRSFYVTATNGACVTPRTAVAVTVNSAMNLTTTVTGSIISANEAGATYQWLDCANGKSIIEGESSQSFTALANGSYSVAISKNGCIDTTSCVSMTITDILSSTKEKEIVISPNPSNGVLKIQTKQVVDNIVVTNTTGEVVFNVIPDITNIVLDMNAYPNGMYFIHLKTNGQIQTEKWVLQK